MMKKIVIFGGTSDLAKKVIPFLETEYSVVALGSKEVDIKSFDEVNKFFQNNEFDIVINFSGKKYDQFISKIKKEDLPFIDDMLKVNINGLINVLSNCLPSMIQRKYGRIIAISSIFSEMNIPKNGIYCASKSFVDRLVGVVNKENIKYGITCNSIQLGYWDGGMCYRVDPKYQEIAKEKIGLKRWGTAEELYKTIDFIIKNEYICGSNLRIDGGI